MKNLVLIISIGTLIIISFSSKAATSSEKTITDRIEYLYDLKSQIDKDLWPDFTNPRFDLSLVYYTDSICYVTNPTTKFILEYNPKLIYQKQALSIYKATPLDRIKFHMETSVSSGDSTSGDNHYVFYMKCSSPELTDKFIPDVHSTEMWSTMVMHEYFHGYQFKHPKFLKFYEEKVNTSADTLKKLYKNNVWFKASIDQENELLLKALNADKQISIKPLIIEFYKLRNHRLKQIKDRLNSDIKIIEQNYELMEGTARYIEYSLYQKFATMQPNMDLLKSDSLFHSYRYFKNYSITKDEWLYLTKSNYFYAIGFNMALLLDKMKVDYKSRLFNEKIFLDEILAEQIK